MYPVLTRAHDDNGSFIKHMLHQAMYNFVGQDLTRLGVHLWHLPIHAIRADDK